MVRAKFKVHSVTEFAPAGVKRNGSIVLTPVTSGSEENKTFWEYTPSGKIEIQTTNGDALDQFKPGDEFYVDFTKVHGGLVCSEGLKCSESLVVGRD